jgi:hypothetical protein
VGRNSNGDICEQSVTERKFEAETKNILEDKPLIEQNESTLRVLIGDHVLLLRSHLMWPCPYT